MIIISKLVFFKFVYCFFYYQYDKVEKFYNKVVDDKEFLFFKSTILVFNDDFFIEIILFIINSSYINCFLINLFIYFVRNMR